MKLPSGGESQRSMGRRQCESNLYEFGLLDIVPDDLILQFFRTIVVAKGLF